MKIRTIIYEAIMAFLALIVVVMTLISMSNTISEQAQHTIAILDDCIWGIFVIDYFFRLLISDSKWAFVKSHKLDLIVILPLDELFIGFRLVRLARVLSLFRAFFFLKVFSIRAHVFLRTNHFNYVLVVTIFILLLGAISISIVEGLSFDDALWWSFVTVTTVGYGDISPETNLGRIIAVILMLVGIGFIGTLTGTIATFFMKRKKENHSLKNKVIIQVQEQLNQFDELTLEDIDDMYYILKSLKIDAEKT
ncbi:MAG: potassium channel family protein [Bacillaceae bacterium]